jgi:hypothetical protein
MEIEYFAPAGYQTPIVQSLIRRYTDSANPTPFLTSNMSQNERKLLQIQSSRMWGSVGVLYYSQLATV